jgi:hypothetical protein
VLLDVVVQPRQDSRSVVSLVDQLLLIGETRDEELGSVSHVCMSKVGLDKGTFNGRQFSYQF